jgi:hypothetical protein
MHVDSSYCFADVPTDVPCTSIHADIQEEDKVDLQKFKKKIEKAQSEKRKKKANNTT